MRQRVFTVPDQAATWRVLLALVLIFLPFSAFAATLIFLTRALIDPQAVSGAEFIHLLGGLISAGLVHEVGHWLAAGPGVRIGTIATTQGMATVRIRLLPELETGSLRWTCSMLGGAAANLLVVGLLLLLRGEGSWPVYYIFLHLLTALLNLAPYRTVTTGPSDGWILLSGLRNRTQRT